MEEAPFVDSLIGVRIGGRYVVDKVLGTGGMGVVVMARYPELAQKVAIKFLLPQHAANAILNARFVREARLAAMVKSEHFVRVFDIGKLQSGIPYLVMELLSGRDLGDELGKRSSLSVEQAIDFVLQAAVGIAEIHALGVVHRDLKPSNLFIAEAAGKQMIKVLDFGISKESTTDSGAPLTATDNVLGTPHYMSPEQVRASKDVDARSDIWSLGVILYELLTKQRPFTSPENGVGEIFAKVLYFDPTPPRELRTDLPEGLEAVVLKCLAREPSSRFATVGELAESLRPFASASSAHRIDAVFQALTTRRSMMPPPTEAEIGADLDSAVSQQPTAESTPVAKRELVDLLPTRVVGASGASVDAAVTAMTSSGVPSPEPEPRGGKRPVAWVAGSVLVLGALAVGIASRRAPDTAPQPTKLVMPPQSEREPSASAVVESPSLASSAPAALSSSAPTVIERPAVRALAPSSKTPRATASSPPHVGSASRAKQPAPSDPILDRK